MGATTNQIQGVSGLSYDNNGNELYGGVAYDAENRVLTAPGVQYAYDSQNKRVWKGTFSGSTLTAQETYFYGVDGRKLGTYSLTLNGSQLTATTTQTAVLFGGKRVAVNGVAFVPDRLGSNTQGKYFPYGEDRGTPIANDQVKYATYTRDSATGLDYGDQRYYSNQFGRFMSPDPYKASGGPSDPQSWNRYAYTRGDPITYSDPTGQSIVVGSCDDLINGADQPGCDDGGDLGDNGGGMNGSPCSSWWLAYAASVGITSGCAMSPPSEPTPPPGDSTFVYPGGPFSSVSPTDSSGVFAVQLSNSFFQGSQGAVAWPAVLGFCAAQPELCAVGIAVIYLTYPQLQSLANSISQAINNPPPIVEPQRTGICEQLFEAEKRACFAGPVEEVATCLQLATLNYNRCRQGLPPVKRPVKRPVPLAK